VAENKLEFLTQVRRFWGGLSTAKRAALAFVSFAVLLAVLAISWVGSQVQYDYLYTNLEQKDAAGIAAKLNELKIPHKIEAGGSIKVPADKVHSLRLELASAGLPSGGGVGNEIFDQSHLGATEFEQQVNLRRALEGELARSIGTISGVENARVHLVLPKHRLFAAKSEGASASVILRLSSPDGFGRREVAGIVHLVATAVPNLSHDRVSVVDQNGVTLHRPDSEGGGLGGIAGGQNELAREAEMAIERRVVSLLERSTGPGSVDVRVSLALDTTTRERTEEHFDPKSTALRSEHKTEELTGTSETTVAGVPGAQANLPDVEPTVAAEEGGGAGNQTRKSQTRNWEIDRVVEKILKPAGEVRRMSLAVLVDGRYEPKEGEQVYTPRTPQELEAYENIVRGAVGFDLGRGDTLSLQQLRFSRPELADPAAADPSQLPAWFKYWPYAAGGFGLLFVLSILLLLKRAKKKELQIVATAAAQLSARDKADEQRQLREAEARLLEEELGEDPDAVDPELALRRRTEALEIAASDPATAAIVLRQWLHAGEVKEMPANNG
jgi:flagellar M-ring protein FliF